MCSVECSRNTKEAHHFDLDCPDTLILIENHVSSLPNNWIMFSKGYLFLEQSEIAIPIVSHATGKS